MARTLWYNYEGFWKATHIVRLLTVILSVFISLASQRSFGIWCGGWLFILRFFGTCSKDEAGSCQTLIRYYIVQNVGRRLWIIGLIFHQLGGVTLLSIRLIMILSGVFIKLGVFPFSFWVGSVIRDLNWEGRFLVRTVSKVASLIVLSRTIVLQTLSFGALTLALFMTLAHARSLGIGCQHWGAILGYSSLMQITPLIVMVYLKKESIALFYLLLYTLIIGLCILHIYSVSMSSQEDAFKINERSNIYLWLWRLCGIPPSIGFVLKCVFILSSVHECFLIVCLYIGFSVATWIFYLWETISLIIIEKPLNSVNSKGRNWIFSLLIRVGIIATLPTVLVCTNLI
jgi:NADH:ubiquinone oxidoreductase subunit 2 (subunit N)